MERIRTPKVDNVLLLSRSSSQRSQVGRLHLTDTHIIFVDKEDQSKILILHSLVGNIKKHKGSQRGFPLIIHCKNFQVLQFIVPRESDRSDLYVSLFRLSRPEMYTELYCFSFNPYVDKSERENSWKFLDLKAEYSRMGLPNKLWHVTPINQDYRVCDTYPEELFVPNSVTLPVIVGSSKFRSKGRFPTLSYYCKESHAAICRSSQPLSGFSARCLEDEHILQAIMKSNPGSRFMYVVDTRPKLNVMANQAAGKGYENEDNYSNIKFQFIGIENIHVMRSSQQKLIQASALFSSSMGEFLLGVERSDWLKHIQSILNAGIFISKAVREQGVSVLVHCSDGWDQTAQVCSVSSVLLDPYFRTIKGLMVLIEKDWVFFGHKFSHRYNHLNEEHKEASPVIDQFLECVWQIMEQFPCSFEYNERFLVSIHEHVYSCHYGNFICDSPKERQDLCIKEKTYSIWPRFWENKMDFMNPLYKPDQGLLRPNTAPYCFKYWRGLYNHFDVELHPRQSELDCLMVIKEETEKLEAQLVLFEQKRTVLDMEHAKTLYMDKGVFNSKHASDLSDTHQDYSGGFTGAALIAFSSQQEERDSEDQREIFNLKSSNLDCSDQESGVADFSSHDSSGEESLPSEDSVPGLESEKASHKRACKHTI